MSKNVTLWGASYSDVPSIEVPSTGGGVAAFHDVTDTTAVAEDVAIGKFFHASDGTLTEGTNFGGGGGTGGAVWQDEDGYVHLDAKSGDEWTRPRDFPDYSRVTLGDNEIFLTYKLDIYGIGSSFNACRVTAGSSDRTITFERGYLSGGTFVSEVSETLSGNTVTHTEDFSEISRNYVVIRLTSSGNITSLSLSNYTMKSAQPCVEIYGKSGGYTGSIYLEGPQYVRSITLFGVVNVSGLRFMDAVSLCNLNIPNLDTSGMTSFINVFRGCWSLTKLPPIKVSSLCTNLRSMFQDCVSLTEIDTTGWDTSNVTTMQDMCTGCRSLKS